MSGTNKLTNIIIPNNKVKFKYGEAPWINKNIKFALSKRSRLAKRYYVNGQVQSDYNLLLSHSKNGSQGLASLCTFVSNSSVLPGISFHTNTCLNSFTFKFI